MVLKPNVAGDRDRTPVLLDSGEDRGGSTMDFLLVFGEGAAAVQVLVADAVGAPVWVAVAVGVIEAGKGVALRRIKVPRVREVMPARVACATSATILLRYCS